MVLIPVLINCIMLSVYRFSLIVCSLEGNGTSAEVRDVSDNLLLIWKPQWESKLGQKREKYMVYSPTLAQFQGLFAVVRKGRMQVLPVSLAGYNHATPHILRLKPYNLFFCHCVHRTLPVHLKAWPLPGWYHLPDKSAGVSCPAASSFQSL